MRSDELQKLKQRNKKAALDAWQEGKLIIPALPARMTLNLSTKCNLRCKMCQFHRKPEISNRVSTKLGELPKDIFEDFADQVFPTLTEAETTTIGEPMLSSYLPDIIAKAEEFAVKLYFTTNAHLLNEKVLDKLWPVLSTLVVSIDAVNPELYESIRIGGSFERVKTQILRFLEMKETIEILPKPELTLQMTLMKSNIEELPKMVNLAAKVGADRVKAYHAYIYDEEMLEESLFFHKNLSNRFIEESKSLASKTGVKLMVPSLFNTEFIFSKQPKKHDFSIPPCLFLWTESFLEPTGEITPCFFPYRQPVGSIKKKKFYKIWNGRKYELLRKQISDEPPPKFCINCELRYTYLEDYKGPGINACQFLLTNDPTMKLYLQRERK